MSPKRSPRPARTSAEWVTFAVSLAILLGVAGLILSQALGTTQPPAPAAELAGEVREEDGRFYVPVTVTNEGDATAEAVQVTASLTIGAEVTEADQSVDFLAGGESEQLEFVFDTDPAGGELEVEVTGYQIP